MAVRLLALPDSVASYDDDTLNQLLCKHTSAPENLTMPVAKEADYPFYVVQEEDIRTH